MISINDMPGLNEIEVSYEGLIVGLKGFCKAKDFQKVNV
jgi:hypothetical protein